MNDLEKAEKIAEKILKKWFVITPKKEDPPDGDVWGMDTSLGTIKGVKDSLTKDIYEVLK